MWNVTLLTLVHENMETMKGWRRGLNITLDRDEGACSKLYGYRYSPRGVLYHTGSSYMSSRNLFSQIFLSFSSPTLCSFTQLRPVYKYQHTEIRIQRMITANADLMVLFAELNFRLFSNFSAACST